MASTTFLQGRIVADNAGVDVAATPIAELHWDGTRLVAATKPVFTYKTPVRSE